MSFNNDLRLPVQLRSFLKKPIGYLISGEEFIKTMNNFEIIISVGDQVSISLIEQELFPQLMIIDFKTKREPISEERQILLENLKEYHQEIVSNPSGVLTKELMILLQSLCSRITTSDRNQLIVEGEEDLAALPAILFAPVNATIIYGMPYKGVVIVPATDVYKEKVKQILSEMN